MLDLDIDDKLLRELGVEPIRQVPCVVLDMLLYVCLREKVAIGDNIAED